MKLEESVKLSTLRQVADAIESLQCALMRVREKTERARRTMEDGKESDKGSIMKRVLQTTPAPEMIDNVNWEFRDQEEA